MMKIKTILICLILGIFFAFSSFAADGQLSFSDPSGNVGDSITLNLKVRSDTALSRADISLRYDGNALQFVSGTKITPWPLLCSLRYFQQGLPL